MALLCGAEGQRVGQLRAAPGAERSDTIEQMRALQTAIEALGVQYEAEYGVNPVAYALAEVGGNTGRPLAGADTKDPDLLGGVAVELIDPDLRPYSSAKFVRDLQQTVERHPLVETLSFRRWGRGPGGSNLDVQFFGASSAGLKAAAEELKTALARYGEVSAVEDSMAFDKDELVLDLTPQGAALGFTIDGLGRVLRDRLAGSGAATPRRAAHRGHPGGFARRAGSDFLERTQLRIDRRLRAARGSRRGSRNRSRPSGAKMACV